MDSIIKVGGYSNQQIIIRGLKSGQIRSQRFTDERLFFFSEKARNQYQ
jgi:hypothetical protein